MSEYRPTREPTPENRARHGGLTCWEFDNFIVDYQDGALPAAQLRLFEAHLATCPPCRRYLEDYVRAERAAKRAYVDAPAPTDAPAELIEAILKAVRR